MKTRGTQWFNTETGKAVFGVQVYKDDKWMDLAEDGKPVFFGSAPERDAYRRGMEEPVTEAKTVPKTRTKGRKKSGRGGRR